MGHCIHHAQSGLGIVARQDDDLKGRLFGEDAVEVQQALDERKGGARLWNLVPVRRLITLERRDAFMLVDLILEGEIEQRGQGNADDKLVFDWVGQLNLLI